MAKKTKSKTSKPEVPKKKPATGHTALTSDERDLWDYVTASVDPLDLKDRVSDIEELTEPVPRRRPSKKAEKQKSQPLPMLPPPPILPTPPTSSKSPALAPFDTRKAKKIARGRQGIDARIDLHGLRQDEARARLNAFLRRAADNGLSTVLVITGKGRETEDPYMTFGEMLDRSPRGVLRRNVPRWLEEPDLRPLVVSWTTAAVQHGGDGALYIHIRKKRG